MLFRFLSLSLLLVSSLARSYKAAVPESTPSSDDGSRSAGLLSNSISPLEPREISDWQVASLIIVSDIDGSLHGIDRKTGASLWTLPMEEPLVHISGNISEDNSDTNLLWFVEPFEDGSLFYFSPAFGLNKLPTSVKNLVMESPFSLNGDDKIYTGTRRTSLYTLNKLTGEVTKSFGKNSDSCPTSIKYSGLGKNAGHASHDIMLGKTTYELSIHSKIDSSVVWNVTYSHWGPNNIDSDLMVQNRQSADQIYFTPFYEKSLLALSQSSGAPAWISRLPSTAVHIFDVFSHRTKGSSIAIPHPIKEFNSLQHFADGADNSMLNLCFLNKTAHSPQWFAMSYANFPTLIKSAPTSPYQMALQQYEKGFLDQTTIDQMRDFKVLGVEAEFFLTGSHRYGSLSSANYYQPGAKFAKNEPKRIGEGSSDVIESDPPLSNGGGLPPPGLMDGIHFPVPQVVDTEISIIDSTKGLQSNRNKNNEVLPVAYQQHRYPLNSMPVHKVSMLRRITEDLVVMFILICFLVVFLKVGQKLKYLNPERNKAAEPVDEFKRRTAEKDSKDDVARGDPLTDPITLVDPSFGDANKSAPTDSPLNSRTRFNADVSVVESDGTEVIESINQNDETLDDQDQSGTSKKKRKRGSRGGKRGGKSKRSGQSDDETVTSSALSEDTIDTILVDEDFGQSSDDSAISMVSLVKTFPRPDDQLKKLQIDNNLVISNKVLGYGSHGTVVYEGTFENRPVAVKRMLFDFYHIANHEVRLLQESDDHPNVIRYFCSQSNLKEKFLYIALELCVCSLEDSIEKSKLHPNKPKLDIANRNESLHQLASGLSYLHSLKIVHRDLKPQNILLGENSRNGKHMGKSPIRLLISDFGLCKKLDADQSSFGATSHNVASGTSGWRAPELLRPDDYSDSPQHSLLSNQSDNEKRLTKAIDIFSLGCVFFYILSDGYHPFGDRYLREANIIKGRSDLSLLLKRCPGDYVEATHLIRSMIDADPKLRPDTHAVLKHPYFWNTGKKLEFLLKVSDRFEIERRDPPSDLLLILEKISTKVHHGDWLARFNSDFTDNLGKYRKYQTEKVMDLLRALRNKYHHYNDMPHDLQQQMSPLPVGFYSYFNQKFPHLLMEIYGVVEKHLKHEHIFHDFF